MGMRAMKTEKEVNKPMTEDEKAGIAWWNSLTHMARSYWLESAGTAVVAEAWKHFKREQTQTTVNQEGRPEP